VFQIIELPEKKYQVIYADPPWKYGGGKGKNSSKWGNSLSQYPCMKLSELKGMPIDKIAENNCALFLWATSPTLPEAIELISAWGFKYMTVAFVWVKKYRNGKPYCGMGYWTRSATEQCLLAFKGKMERKNNTVYQVIEEPITVHSKKPDEIRERIVNLMGDLTRIELFAREKHLGWDTWGNEVPKETQMLLASDDASDDHRAEPRGIQSLKDE